MGFGATVSWLSKVRDMDENWPAATPLGQDAAEEHAAGGAHAVWRQKASAPCATCQGGHNGNMFLEQVQQSEAGHG